jgi:glycine cleavage system transcriptional repressor
MTTRFPHAYVVNVLSADHPGIVASVSQAVHRLGGNIDACSETVLGGYFSLIMIVSLPQSLEPAALAEAVQAADRSQDGYQVLARRFLVAKPPAGEAPERFVITAFGKDHPGILLKFSQLLASKDINIVDLYGNLQGEDFVVISQVDIPRRWDLAMLQADLEALAKAEGFTVRLQHENIFVATNQLRLSLSQPRDPGGGA